MSRASKKHVSRKRRNLRSRLRGNWLEALEDRILLFSDPFFSAAASEQGVDLRLLLDDTNGWDRRIRDPHFQREGDPQ